MTSVPIPWRSDEALRGRGVCTPLLPFHQSLFHCPSTRPPRPPTHTLPIKPSQASLHHHQEDKKVLLWSIKPQFHTPFAQELRKPLTCCLLCSKHLCSHHKNVFWHTSHACELLTRAYFDEATCNIRMSTVVCKPDMAQRYLETNQKNSDTGLFQPCLPLYQSSPTCQAFVGSTYPSPTLFYITWQYKVLLFNPQWCPKSHQAFLCLLISSSVFPLPCHPVLPEKETSFRNIHHTKHSK